MIIPQYITQIDKEWFGRVSKRPVQGTCIRFDDSVGEYSINVDIEALKGFLKFLSEDEADEKYAIREELEDDYVTTDTAQTITGSKKFSGTVYIESDETNKYFLIRNGNETRRGYLGMGDVYLDKNEGEIGLNYRNVNSSKGGVNRARVYFANSDGNLHLHARPASGSGYKANGVVLDIDTEDTTSTSSKAVPTLGWVNEKFVRKPDEGTPYTGTKKEITDIKWDGTKLYYESVTRTYKNGLLCGETANPATVIDTAVLYSPT